MSEQRGSSRDQTAQEMPAGMRAVSQQRPPVPPFDPYFPLPTPGSSEAPPTKSHVPFRIYGPTRR
jgi:hypothetical protein